MNDIQLNKLQKNLTKSSKKAKKYWVRGMVGFTESDQGFFPIEAIPVTNTIKGRSTTLAELFEDVGTLNKEHNELIEAHDTLVKELEAYKSAQVELQDQNKIEMDALSRRISEIEAFKID